MNAKGEVLTALGYREGQNCVSRTVCSGKPGRLNLIRNLLVISNQPRDGWKNPCALQSKADNEENLYPNGPFSATF